MEFGGAPAGRGKVGEGACRIAEGDAHHAAPQASFNRDLWFGCLREALRLVEEFDGPLRIGFEQAAVIGPAGTQFGWIGGRWWFDQLRGGIQFVLVIEKVGPEKGEAPRPVWIRRKLNPATMGGETGRFEAAGVFEGPGTLPHDDRVRLPETATGRY